MLPDPDSLRGAASGLAATESELRRLCADLVTCLTDVRWAAPAVDVVRRQLAEAQAAALTGCRGLQAGGAHLRAVALAVEDLAQASRRLRDAAEAELRARLAAATSPLEAAVVQQLLDRLPPRDDPHWAQAAGARPVPLPLAGSVPVPAVAPSPPGVVEADLEGVRRLADRCRGTAVGVAAAGDSTRVRVGALGLADLDAYGLAGSALERWLTALAGPPSPLAAAAQRWELAAREADLLVRLLSTADRPGELLADPRLAAVLAVLAAQLRGPVAVRVALDGLPVADRSWVADLVPGLVAPPAPAHRSFWHRVTPYALDIGALLVDLWKRLPDVAGALERGSLALVREAAAVGAAVQGLSEEAAAAGRARVQWLLRGAAGLTRVRRLWLRLPGWLRETGWLRRLDETALWEDGLHGVSRLGGLAALVGVVYDVVHGTPVVAAVTKAVVLLAVGAGIAALAAGLLASAPVWVTVVAAVAVGIITSKIYDRVAPGVGRVATAGIRGLGRGAGHVSDRTKQAERVAGRALDRAAGGVERALGRLHGLTRPVAA